MLRDVLSFIVFIIFASCNASSTVVPSSTYVTGSREEVIPIQITVQVSENVARALHKRSPPTSESKELLRIMETFGITLDPMYPNTDTPNLQSYFIVEAPDSSTAQRVIDRLQQSEGVEAVYIKPPDEPP